MAFGFSKVESVAFLVRFDGEVIAKTFLISKTSHCSFLQMRTKQARHLSSLLVVVVKVERV